MNIQEFRLNIYSLIAKELNIRKINHSATHGISYRPISVGRDIDIMVEYCDRKVVLEIITKVLKDNSISFNVIKNLWAFWVVGFKEIDGSIHDIEIDVFWSILYWGVELTDKKSLSFNKNNKNEFYQEHFNSFAKIFLINFFSKRYSKLNETRKNEISKLCELLILEDSKLNISIGYELYIRIVKAASEFDSTKLDQLRIETKISYFFLHNPFRYLYNLAIFVIWKIQEKTYYNKLPYFSLSGPDGVGKSTYLNEIKSKLQNTIFTSITLKHWRPNLFPNISDFSKFDFNLNKNYKVNNLPPRKKAGKWGAIRILIYTLDYIFGYYFLDRKQRKGLNLLFYDRHFIDMIIHPERFGINSFYRIIMVLIFYIVPKPNYMLFLFDTPQNISTRKSELSGEEIDSQIEIMTKLKKLSKRIITINVSNIDDTTRMIFKTIYEKTISD